MKIIFKKSTPLEEYHGFYKGKPIDFKDEEKKNVPDELAKQFLADFPDNFSKTKAEKKVVEKAPKDKMIKGEEVKKK